MHESQPAAGHAEALEAQLLNTPVFHAETGWRGAQLLEPRPVTVLDKVSNKNVVTHFGRCLIQ
jgi:UDP-N-acetylglucosamine 2-epimerase